MDIRTRLNNNPRLVAGTVGVLILIVLAIALASRSPVGGFVSNLDFTKEFFSVDDGKNFFPEDARKLPPFDHQGKLAYRARVFKCGNGKPFVAYLERYSDSDRKRLEELLSAGSAAPPEAVVLLSKVEVKKPGSSAWVGRTPAAAQRFDAIHVPRCPDGSTTGIVRVSPE